MATLYALIGVVVLLDLLLVYACCKVSASSSKLQQLEWEYQRECGVESGWGE